MEEKKLRKDNFKLGFWASVVFVFLFFASINAARAATLYYSPTSGTYKVGQKFSVSIYVASADQAMNAAEGTISFPKDILSAVSISKSGSIMTLWAQEPSFSNSAGTIDFSGVDFNPGYTGAAGKIMTITFKAKAEGAASLNFDSASVLANDGAGTNIFTGDGSANFNIVAESAPPVSSEGGGSVSEKVPVAPKVNSPTHPDSAKWYANSNPTFNWILTKDITGINVFGDHNSTTNPGTKSDGLRNSWTYKNVDDGAWYFHLRLKNSAGWGAIAHFGFNIDTVPPEIISATLNAADATDPSPVLQIKAADKTSGIDHYEVSVDSAAASVFPDSASGEYQLSALSPGDHRIVVKAFDKAGNVSAPYELLRSVVALQTPVITDYSMKAALGGKVMVQGTTIYPNIKVMLWYQKDGGSPAYEIAQADGSGNFIYNLKDIQAIGSYKLWAEVQDARGAKSNPTEKVEFVVYESFVFQLFAWAKSNILWLFIALLILSLLIIITLYIRRLVRTLWLLVAQEKITKENFYTSRRRIDGLSKMLEKHVIMLDKLRKKRRLSWKEKYLRHRYRKLAKRLRKYINSLS